MGLLPCPECGHEISDQALFCPHCGYPLKDLAGRPAGQPSSEIGNERARAGPTVCPQCGTPQQPGDAFCGNCGHPTPTMAGQPEQSVERARRWRRLLALTAAAILLLAAGGTTGLLLTRRGGKEATTTQPLAVTTSPSTPAATTSTRATTTTTQPAATTTSHPTTTTTRTTTTTTTLPEMRRWGVEDDEWGARDLIGDVLRVTVPQPGNMAWSFHLTSAGDVASYSNVRFGFDAQITSSTGSALIVLRQVGDEYYRVAVTKGGWFTVCRHDGNGWRPCFVSEQLADWLPDARNTIELSLAGVHLTTVINGVAGPSGQLDRVAYGQLGLGAWNQGEVAIVEFTDISSDYPDW